MIVHDAWGVFLGATERPFATFWTHQFNHGAPTDVAQCFDTAGEAIGIVRSWGVQDVHWLAQIRTHCVIPDIFPGGAQRFASMQACIAAGLRGWVSEKDVAALVALFEDEEEAVGGRQEGACPRPRPH